MDTILKLSVASYEGSLFGWDLLGNEEGALALDMTYGFHCCHGSIRSVAMSPNGKYLVCGGTDEMIRIFDVKTKKSVGDLAKHTGSITALHFVGNGFLISSSEDFTMCIWRVHDWQCLHILGGHKDIVNDIAVHPSGKVLMSVSKDNTIRLWNLITGKMAFTRSLKRQANKVKWDQHNHGQNYLIAFDNEVQNFLSADNTLTCTITKSKYVRVHQADYLCLTSADELSTLSPEEQLNRMRIVVLFDDRSLHVYDGNAKLITAVNLSMEFVSKCTGGRFSDAPSSGKPKDFTVSKTSFGSSDGEIDNCISIVTTNGNMLVFSARALDSYKEGSSLEDCLLCSHATSSEPRFTCIVAWNQESVVPISTTGPAIVSDVQQPARASAGDDDEEEVMEEDGREPKDSDDDEEQSSKPTKKLNKKKKDKVKGNKDQESKKRKNQPDDSRTSSQNNDLEIVTLSGEKKQPTPAPTTGKNVKTNPKAVKFVNNQSDKRTKVINGSASASQSDSSKKVRFSK